MTTPQEIDQARWEICRDLARDVLLLGPDGADLKLSYLQVLIDEGLPTTTAPRRVVFADQGFTGRLVDRALAPWAW